MRKRMQTSMYRLFVRTVDHVIDAIMIVGLASVRPAPFSVDKLPAPHISELNRTTKYDAEQFERSDFLSEKNRVLREQLARRRLRFTNNQRHRRTHRIDY